MNKQHSPISRRALLGGIGAKAAAAGALGVVAAQEAADASRETEAERKSPGSSEGGVKTEGRPAGIGTSPGEPLGGHYSDYYDYSDSCGYKGGVAYAGLALLIARACGRLRGKSDDHRE